MSAKILGQVWDLQLPAPKLLVLLALADHADHNGNNVYPSIELVAWKTGYSESQARRIIKALVKDGLLEATPRAGKTTRYSIHLDQGIKKTPFRDKGFQDDTPSKTEGVSLSDTPTPAIQMTPEPSFEPSRKEERKPDEPRIMTIAEKTQCADKLIRAWADAYAYMGTFNTSYRRRDAIKLVDMGATYDEIRAMVSERIKNRTKPYLFKYVVEDYSEWKHIQGKRDIQAERDKQEQEASEAYRRWYATDVLGRPA